MEQSDIFRYGIFIVMMIGGAALMADATNYIVLTKTTVTNLSNQTTSAEFIIAGTFGQAVGNGSFTFPSNLNVNGSLLVGGVNVINLINSNNNTMTNITTTLGNGLGYLQNQVISNNNTLTNLIGTKGNVSSSGNTPYIPYFFTPALLVNSPIYVESSNKVIVQGTANFTGMTANTTFEGDVQIKGKLYGGSPVKIAGGLDVISGNANFGDIFVSSCDGCVVYSFNQTTNFSSINATNITAINLVVTGNVTFPPNTFPIFNESGISRNYSMQVSTATPNITITLPAGNKIISVDVKITGTSVSTPLMLIFNDDMGNNYMYKRIQAYTFLYQGVTVQPRTNITMEGYSSSLGRDIKISVIPFTNSAIGYFKVILEDNTTAPFMTDGNFDWRNNTLSTMTIQTVNGVINSGSYIIVKSEGL